MQVKEFDNFSYPQRKPWIIWILILVILLVAVRQLHKRRRTARESAGDNGVSVETVVEATVRGRVATVTSTPTTSAVARDAVRRAIAQARTMIEADAYLAARDVLFEALDIAGSDTVLRRDVEDLLGSVHIELVLTPRPMPEKVDYLVQRGDSVARIANRHGTTVELVQRSNRIANPDLIRAGDRMTVLNKPFRLLVDKTRNDLVLQLDGRFFKRYNAGTGKYGRTPVGTFVVSDRIPEPVWWRPDGRAIPFGDPENILGTRWLAIRATGDTEDARGYGIHGTWNDASIGHAESAGCVRMHNPDVEELFMLVPVGTPVTIVEGD